MVLPGCGTWIDPATHGCYTKPPTEMITEMITAIGDPTSARLSRLRV